MLTAQCAVGCGGKGLNHPPIEYNIAQFTKLWLDLVAIPTVILDLGCVSSVVKCVNVLIKKIYHSSLIYEVLDTM